MKNNAKARYKHKTKTKTITFYLNEKALYEFTKGINFQAFVKKALRDKMLEEQIEERGYEDAQD